MTECELLQQILVESVTTNALLFRLVIVGTLLVAVGVVIGFWLVTRR